LGCGLWPVDDCRRGMSPDEFTCSTVVNACVRGKDPHQAAWWLRELSCSHGLQSAMCYSAVVQALARAGEIEEARKLFEEATNSGKDLSSGCLAVLVGACQRAGDFEGAARWQKEAANRGVQLGHGRSAGAARQPGRGRRS